MRRFTDAGRQALSTDNWYAALSLALTIPDICGSLEDPGPNKSGPRYDRWCTKWLVSRYTMFASSDAPQVLLSGKDHFALRCSLIHSGSTEIEPRRGVDVTRVLFADRTIQSDVVRDGTVLFLRVDAFCENVFDAAERWDDAMKGDENVQREKAKLLSLESVKAEVGQTLIL